MSVERFLPLIIPFAIALLAFLEARHLRQIRRLKIKLRRALTDCRALYEIEARFCEASASSGVFGTDSPAAVKRLIRQAVRIDGMQSPSEEATPLRISQELAKL